MARAPTIKESAATPNNAKCMLANSIAPGVVLDDESLRFSQGLGVLPRIVFHIFYEDSYNPCGAILHRTIKAFLINRVMGQPGAHSTLQTHTY
jgi:hypothetical protein